MDSPCPGRVLLVGDGDFSFTLALLKAVSPCDIPASHVTTSNLHTQEQIQQHQQAQGNMEAIIGMGGTVYLETDARELHTHPAISLLSYHRIIFNFPLADRHNIKKNRALLADFFSSCNGVLSEGGQVMVTLCKGQGGTPADRPLRSWHDSWQVVAMAAQSGFCLARVDIFEAARFPEYHSVGFRFQDKSFMTDGALTHVFERLPLVEVGEPALRSLIHDDEGNNFSCSAYIAEKWTRNLLQETDNPVSLTALMLTDVRDAHSLPTLIPGRTSYIQVELKHKSADSSSSPAAPSFSGDETLKELKDQMNAQQQNKDRSERDLVHGVVQSEEEDPVQHTAAATADCVKDLLDDVFPCDPEAVCHAIKHCEVHEDGGDGEEMEVESINGGGAEAEVDQSGDHHSLVYHLRASLLEQLKTFLSLAVGNLPAADEDGLNCSVFFGQTYRPCGIGPRSMPVRHEMLSVHKVKTVCEEERVSAIGRETMDSINSCLEGRWSVKSQPVNESVLVRVDELHLANLNTLDLSRCHDDSDPNKPQRDNNVSLTIGMTCSVKLGSDVFDVCLVNVDSLACAMCALPHPSLLWSDHDKFTGQFRTDGFPQEFKPFSLFPMKFVHDLSFWLRGGDDGGDDDGDDTLFDEREMFDVIRCVAGDVVVRVDMVDAYHDSSTGRPRHSRCYRLHFCSHDQVMPYSTSWKLQSRVRVEVARRCQVTLR